MMTISSRELSGSVPVGPEREMKNAACPNCLHHPMKERTYMQIGTGEERTIQTCPVCGCMAEV
jgi:RNase P subunit RPR2